VVTVRTKPDVQPPSSPQNLVVQAVSDQQINLSWGASTDNTGVHGYKIYRGLAPGALALVGYTPDLAASHSPLKPSTTYYYRVTAVDLSGNESQPTPIVAATTQADQQPPTIPQNLVVQAVSDQQINLSWEASIDSNGVYGYKIYRGLAPDSLTVVGFTPGLAASHSQLGPSTTYYYRVSAVDASGNESAPTPVVAATTHASPDTAAPYVEMVLPANWATVRGTVVLAAFAYDYRKGTYDTPSGIASVRFQLDGANLGPELTVAPYTVAVDTRSLPNGPHLVTAVAVDHAGHAATSAPLTITISN
jgi:chitodextrinase